MRSHAYLRKLKEALYTSSVISCSCNTIWLLRLVFKTTSIILNPSTTRAARFQHLGIHTLTWEHLGLSTQVRRRSSASLCTHSNVPGHAGHAAKAFLSCNCDVPPLGGSLKFRKTAGKQIENPGRKAGVSRGSTHIFSREMPWKRTAKRTWPANVPYAKLQSRRTQRKVKEGQDGKTTRTTK